MSITVEAALRGQQIIWGAPVYPQAWVCWEETQHAAGGVATFDRSRMTATFPGGGRISYRSLDNPDNVRSLTADGVVVDEAQGAKPAAWHEVLRPMLMDTGGWAWLIFTPNGLQFPFAEHTAARDRADSAAWQVPSVGARIVDGRLERVSHPLENPFLPWAEIEQLFATMPERAFRQEILAEFQTQEGSVFRNVAACLTAPATTPDAHAGHMLVMGVDWAQTTDFTALSVVCATCRQEVALDRYHQLDWAFQRARLMALAARWQVRHIEAEHNSIGGPNIEALRADKLNVVGFETTATSKPPLIQSLALAFERHECAWLDDPAGTAELLAFEARPSGTTGRIAYSAPAGMHDDTVIARALAWRAALGGRQPTGAAPDVHVTLEAW